MRHTHKETLCEVRQGEQPKERPPTLIGVTLRPTSEYPLFESGSTSNANLWFVSLACLNLRSPIGRVRYSYVVESFCGYFGGAVGVKIQKVGY